MDHGSVLVIFIHVHVAENRHVFIISLRLGEHRLRGLEFCLDLLQPLQLGVRLLLHGSGKFHLITLESFQIDEHTAVSEVKVGQ